MTGGDTTWSHISPNTLLTEPPGGGGHNWTAGFCYKMAAMWLYSTVGVWWSSLVHGRWQAASEEKASLPQNPKAHCRIHNSPTCNIAVFRADCCCAFGSFGVRASTSASVHCTFVNASKGNKDLQPPRQALELEFKIQRYWSCWVFLTLSRQSRGSTLNWATTASFHIFTHSFFTIYPTAGHCVVWLNWRRR